MPLSKEKNKERMRLSRLVQPKLNEVVQPSVITMDEKVANIIAEVKRLYPHMPNCPDGRFR